MKAIVWEDRDTVAVRSIGEPSPDVDEFLIRVTYASICGSDITIVSGKHPRARPPLVLGHEFAGVVAAVPKGLETGFAVGTRVSVEPLLSCRECRMCRAGHEHICVNLRLLGVETDGGFAEFVTVPQGRVYLLPETISDETAALIEPLSVAVHAVDLAQVMHDDFVAIMGAGPIGLLIAQSVRAAGAEKVWLFERDTFRLNLARSLGFDAIDIRKTDAVQSVLELTDGFGADVAFDAAGAQDTAAQVIQLAGPKGRVVMVAIHKKPCEVDLKPLVYGEQAMLGSRIYAKGDFPKAIELVAKKKVQLEPLVTHVFDIADGEEALDVARRGTDCCKILIRP